MRQRGIYEKAPGTGVWWIRYADAMGRIRREKAGMKGAALTLYRKRKTESLQGKKLPENLRAPTVGFRSWRRMLSAIPRRINARFTMMHCVSHGFWRPSATALPIQSPPKTSSTEERSWAPASVNRYRALLSLIFRLGIESGKVKENPARLVKSRIVNNVRMRWLGLAEELRLRNAIKERYPEHLAELDLALNTGLRLGEMYGLT